MKLASLDSVKFQKIAGKNLTAIRGGDQTGAGQFFSRYESVTKVVDGQVVSGTRAVYTTYNSDDIGGGQECYYGTGTAYGEIHWNW